MRHLAWGTALVLLAACGRSGDRASGTPADSGAAGATRLGTLPTVGVAVPDSADAWCVVIPPAAPALAPGVRVTLVFADAREEPAWRAAVVRRRAAVCPTAVGQPRWSSYVRYDLALLDSLRPAADQPIPPAALAVVSHAEWVRGADGRVRTDLDGDGRPEEARVCNADEGQHFTLWSVRTTGKLDLLAHEYFDMGEHVEPPCSAQASGDTLDPDAA